MKVTVVDGGGKTQSRADMEGSTEEEIGHARTRDGGEDLGGRLDSGYQEGTTLREVAEAVWKRRLGRKEGRSEILELGGTRGRHTEANLISKGQRLMPSQPLLQY